MSAVPRIAAGLVGVELACPVCGVLEVIPALLTAVLTTPADDAPSLRVKCKAKALDHFCGAEPTDLFTATRDDETAR